MARDTAPDMLGFGNCPILIEISMRKSIGSEFVPVKLLQTFSYRIFHTTPMNGPSDFISGVKVLGIIKIKR